jgi:hypothetical protein
MSDGRAPENGADATWYLLGQRKGRADALAEAREAVAFHASVDYGLKYGVEHGKGRLVCDYCDDLNWSTEGLDQKDDIDWPCPTIAAIDALRGSGNPDNYNGQWHRDLHGGDDAA